MSLNSNSLNAAQIKVGCPVPCDCYDGQGRLLLRKGVVIDSQRQVDFLVERGLFRMEDTSGEPSTLESTASNNTTAAKPPSPFMLLNDYSKRLQQLLSSFGDSPSAARDHTGTSFSDRAIELAMDIQKLCKIDADALLGKVHLDHSGRYSISHPVHRAIISELLALRKSVSEELRLYLIAAALTSDMSIQKLQDDLIRQNGPLRPEQQSAILSHPFTSVKLLESLGVTNTTWLQTVLQHHELLNGKGYPNGVSGDNVSKLARILKLSDMYTAMVSPRAYRKTLLNKNVMRDILLKRGSEIDEELAISIIKELGVYPPGAFVKLMNGEIAIVTHRGTNPKTPLVKAVIGSNGVLHRYQAKRRTDAVEFEIHDVVDRDNIAAHINLEKSLNLQELWGY
jgi:HD-GYP domain-containing protein (c-di-GMP phosphodiesterase class II)